MSLPTPKQNTFMLKSCTQIIFQTYVVVDFFHSKLTENMYLSISFMRLVNANWEHTGHYHILAFLHVFPICFDNRLQKPLGTPRGGHVLNAVHKVLDNPLANFIAQMVIVHEDAARFLLQVSYTQRNVPL